MKVSIVIPTYNEERVIKDCLKSISNQSYKNVETIVVDDGSSDKTWNILNDLKNNANLKIFRQNHKGVGASRNLGARHAEGNILVFVDADMTFDKNFLRNLVKPILAGKSKGTFSKYEYVSNWDNVWARCWNVNQNWEPKRRHPRNYPDKQKVFRAILKRQFDRVGGFTPGGYTDDYSLYEKLGFMALSAPGAIFNHENPSSLTEVFRQAKWSGKRKYKLGPLGYIIALIRASFPISIIIGLLKTFTSGEPRFLLFKIVYDFGIFLGILELILLRKQVK
jgi:glycosyltransferase involved in cell wall biosynthesis